jgi:hypothetical protein
MVTGNTPRWKCAESLGEAMSGPLELPEKDIFHRRGGDIKLPGGEMALHFDTSLDDIRQGKVHECGHGPQSHFPADRSTLQPHTDHP